MLEQVLIRWPDKELLFFESAGDALAKIHEIHAHLKNRLVLLYGQAMDMSVAELYERLQDEAIQTPFVVLAGEDHNIPDMSLNRHDVFYRPFRMGALLDRLAKHLRENKTVIADEVVFGSCILYPVESKIVCGKERRTIRLTEKERDMLLRLYQQKGAVVSRQELLDDVWGYAAGLETHTLETHIYRLRQKIEDDPANPMLLVTEEPGYRLM
ncbi:MAG: winged helix-turn-helix domain-containing protein [Rhodospirillales bacterium]|nr:winged helix-turn-helix domain-containing protein [Rhodospirillales bacterium]